MNGKKGFRSRALLSLLLALSLSGCFGSGIRELTETEQRYFEALKEDLEKGDRRLSELLMKDNAANEEIALAESNRLEAGIQRAKLIYSIREVLKAPTGDAAEFVQVTRNKLILYHLAEAAQARNERIASRFALGRAERRELLEAHRELIALVEQAIETNIVLYNHLNKSFTGQLSDVLAETGRQISAFNERIQEADQKNPVIRRLVEAGQTAEERVRQVEQGMTKFIDVWDRLNKNE